MTSTLRPLVSPNAIALGDLLQKLHGPVTRNVRDIRFATGLQPLDDVLGGGFRRQDFVLLTGRPGVGKTITALQWARSCARSDRNAVYVCYEHNARVLLARLFALELASITPAAELPAVDETTRRVQEVILAGGSIDHLAAEPQIRQTYENLSAYSDRLHFVTGSARTDLDAIDTTVTHLARHPTAVFVDYLQRIPAPRSITSEGERAGYIGERLKELAATRDVAVIAISAGDRKAMVDRRVRMHHMRGAAALGYEADVILTLNDKAVAVSRSHLAYDPVRAESFRRQVVLSVEKHRNGPAHLDMEFTKDYSNYHLDPRGSFVAEKLVDDVLYMD